jgi:hypothetical protein
LHIHFKPAVGHDLCAVLRHSGERNERVDLDSFSSAR